MVLLVGGARLQGVARGFGSTYCSSFDDAMIALSQPQQDFQLVVECSPALPVQCIESLLAMIGIRRYAPVMIFPIRDRAVIRSFSLLRMPIQMIGVESPFTVEAVTLGLRLSKYGSATSVLASHLGHVIDQMCTPSLSWTVRILSCDSSPNSVIEFVGGSVARRRRLERALHGSLGVTPAQVLGVLRLCAAWDEMYLLGIEPHIAQDRWFGGSARRMSDTFQRLLGCGRRASAAFQPGTVARTALARVGIEQIGRFGAGPKQQVARCDVVRDWRGIQLNELQRDGSPQQQSEFFN